MARQLFIGYTREGTTDDRFLESIIKRTFDKIVFDCLTGVDIADIISIPIKGENFNRSVELAAQQAFTSGLNILCVHTDADDRTPDAVMKDKIIPAFNNILHLNKDSLCQNLISIIPVRMTESWMLADKELLRNEIGTNKTEHELGIEKKPESYADPKQIIKNAISISMQEKTKRRRKELNIADLYATIGQKITIDSLETLPSYRRFCEEVRYTLQKMNLL